MNPFDAITQKMNRQIIDLEDEVAYLKLQHAAMKAEWEKAYEIGMLAKEHVKVLREALLTCVVTDGKDRDHYPTYTYNFDEGLVADALSTTNNQV